MRKTVVQLTRARPNNSFKPTPLRGVGKASYDCGVAAAANRRGLIQALGLRTRKMLTYADGSPIKIGDSVLLENGQTPGIVELVVATPEAMQELGVDVPGVMLLSPPFGRVYIPEQSLQSEPLELVSRRPAA